jgi:hypothetical protein
MSSVLVALCLLNNARPAKNSRPHETLSMDIFNTQTLAPRSMIFPSVGLTKSWKVIQDAGKLKEITPPDGILRYFKTKRHRWLTLKELLEDFEVPYTTTNSQNLVQLLRPFVISKEKPILRVGGDKPGRTFLYHYNPMLEDMHPLQSYRAHVHSVIATFSNEAEHPFYAGVKKLPAVDWAIYDLQAIEGQGSIATFISRVMVVVQVITEKMDIGRESIHAALDKGSKSNQHRFHDFVKKYADVTKTLEALNRPEVSIEISHIAQVLGVPAPILRHGFQALPAIRAPQLMAT